MRDYFEKPAGVYEAFPESSPCRLTIARMPALMQSMGAIRGWHILGTVMANHRERKGGRVGRDEKQAGEKN